MVGFSVAYTRRIHDCRHVDAAFGKQSYLKNVITDPCHSSTMFRSQRKSFKSKSGFDSPLFASSRAPIRACM